MFENAKPGAEPRQQLIQIEWGVPNDAIREIYTLMAGIDKNLIVTHHMTDRYEDRMVATSSGSEIKSFNTGERILEGLTHTPRFVDISLQFKKEGNSGGPVFTNEFLKCGNNPTLEGGPGGDTWDRTMAVVEGSLGGRITLPHNEDWIGNGKK